MSHLETYIDPTTTNNLIKNLSLAIDEAKLVIRLNSLNNQIYSIESSEGRTERSLYLLKEVTVVEVQLNYIRDRAV